MKRAIEKAQRGRPGFTLQVEGRRPVNSPAPARLRVVVREMISDCPPGFLIVEHESGSYAQAAGGSDSFTVERRDVSDDGFTHWVAGRPEDPDGDEVAIRANGFDVHVRSNERLRGADVITILTAFLDDTEPDGYVWRDVSDRFESA